MNSHPRFAQADVSQYPAAQAFAGASAAADSEADEQTLLLHEVNHRIRNLLAMVEAVVRQTQSSDVGDYRAKVLARLSRFHDFYEVVGSRSGETVPLARLLRETMGSY